MNDKILILIVDDEEELLEMFKECFEMSGFRALTASSASAGLQIYKNNQEIQVIISDSEMMGMSGLDFLKNLKEIYTKIPNFYLSTGSVEKSDAAVKLLGGSGLFLKPFDIDEILFSLFVKDMAFISILY